MSDEFHFDLGSSAFAQDPYPILAALRAREHLHRADMGWIASRYDDVVKLFLDDRLQSRSAEHDELAARAPSAGSLLALDPPDHARIRRVVAPWFTPRAVADRAAALRRVFAAHAPRLRPLDGSIEIVSEFAHPVAAGVIAEYVGIPQHLRPSLDLAATTALHDGGAAACELIGELVRHPPARSVLSGVHDAVRQGVITELEATGVVGLLVIAGHDTTTGLVANALVALGRHPEVEAQLRGDRSLIPAFVEEVLRVDAPVQHLGRWAATDFEHHGVHVSAGDEVVLLLGSANRDETVWRHVDRVSLAEARISPHLAFGWGRHRCLGATLARMEGELAVQAILDAFDDLTPLEPITYREPANVRCPNRIVLGLEP